MKQCNAIAFSMAAVIGISLPCNQASAQTVSGCKGPPSDYQLYVTVEKIRSDKGEMTLTVYGSDVSRYLKKNGSLYVARFKIKKPVSKLCLNLPGPGEYSVAVYHDANANGKFDRSKLGLPIEAFGFTRNPFLMFGPPDFDDTSISVQSSGENVRIKLRKL